MAPSTTPITLRAARSAIQSRDGIGEMSPAVRRAADRPDVADAVDDQRLLREQADRPAAWSRSSRAIHAGPTTSRRSRSDNVSPEYTAACAPLPGMRVDARTEVDRVEHADRARTRPARWSTPSASGARNTRRQVRRVLRIAERRGRRRTPSGHEDRARRRCRSRERRTWASGSSGNEKRQRDSGRPVVPAEAGTQWRCH